MEDLNKYNAERKKFVQDWVKRNGHIDITESVAIMAIASACPCIVVAYWIGEMFNWPDSVKKNVDSLMKFYRYSGVKNKPEGCPW